MAAELAIIVKLQDEASSGIRALRGEVEGLEPSAGIAAKGFQSLQTVGAAALTAIAATAVALGGFLVGSVDKAAALEAQMDTVAALLGATADQAELLRQATIDLALDPQLKVSATEAAQAIEMLAQNGLTVEQILGGAAEATVQLANATGADFTTAARIATDAMALWGMEADQLGQVADGVTAVLVQSKFEVNDYALALAQAGGVAAAVGVSFQDFNATLVAIAPFFASGSDAGTSFKAMLQRLLPTTNAAKDAMAALGLITEEGANAFFNADGSMKDMAEVAGILHGALSGLTEQQRLQALSTIFGTDAMRAAAAMSQFTEEQFRNLMAVMANTSAAEIAAQRMENFSGAMDILRGVIEGLQLQIGNVLLPILTQLALAGANLLAAWGPPIIAAFEELTAIVGEFFSNIAAGMSIWGALRSALMDIGQLFGMTADEAIAFSAGVTNAVEAIVNFISPIVQAIASFVSWKDVLIGLGIAIASAVLGIAGVLVQLLAPIALVILAAAALRTAWETNFLGIRTMVEGLVETFGRFVSAFQDSFQDSGDIVGALVVAFQNLVGPTSAAGEAFLRIGEAVRNVIGFFVTLVDTLRDGGGFTDFLNNLANAGVITDGFRDKIANFVLLLQGVFQPTIDRIREAIGGLGDSMAPVGEKLAGLKDAFLGLLQALAPVGAAIAAVVGIIAKFLGEVLAGVINNAGAIIGGLVTAMTGVVDGVTNAVQSLVSIVSAILQGDWAGAWEAAKGFVIGWVDATRTQIEGLVQVFDGLAGAVWDAVANTFNDLTGAALPSWEQFKQAAGEAFQGVVDRIREVLGTLQDAVQPIIDFFAPTIERIQQAFSGLGDSLAPVGEKLGGLREAFGQLQQALEPVWNVLQSLATSVLSGLGQALAGVGAAIGAVIAIIAKFLGEVLAGIINNASTIIGGLVTAVTGVVQGITSSVQAIVDFVRSALEGDWAAAWGAAASYVSGMVSAVGTILSGLLQVVDGIVGAVWDAVVNTFNDLTGSSLASWEEFKQGVIQKLTEIKDSISSKVDEWKQAFVTFIDNVQSINIGESIRTFIVEGLENIVEAIRDQVAQWVDAFTGFVDDVQSADIGQSIVDFILDGLETFVDHIADTLSDWYSAFVDWVSDIDWYEVGYNIVDFIIQALVIFPQEVAATLAEWAQAFWDWAESTAADLWDAGVQLVENIIEGLREFPSLAWDALSEWASVFWDWATDTASELWDAGVELVRNIVEGLEEFPGEAQSAVSDWSQVFSDWASDTAGQLWDAGVQLVQNIVEGLKEFPAKAQETLATWITAFAQWVGNSVAQLVIIGTAIVTHIVTGLQEFWVKAVTTVSGWFTSISTFVSTKIASLIALGQSIVQGIIQGIQSMAQAVINAATAVIQGGIDAIRNALGNPHSPAPALIPLGSSISEGLAAGIQQGAGMIIGAIQQVASQMELEAVKAFSEAVAAIGEAIESAVQSYVLLSGFGGAETGGAAAGLASIVLLMQGMVDAFAAANEHTAEVLELVGKFADAVDSIVSLIADSLLPLRTLASIDLSFLQSGNLADGLAALRDLLVALVAAFAEAAAELGVLGPLVESFTGAAEGVVSLVEDALRAAALLSGFNFTAVVQGDHLADQIVIFRNIVRTMVREFADAALEFAFMSEAVQMFTEAAEGVIGLVEDGLHASMLLSGFNFGAAVQGWHLRDQIIIFRNIVQTMVREFIDAALEFGYMGEAVEAFTEAAEGVIGLVEEGLHAVMLLSGFNFGAAVQGWHLADQIVIFRNIVRTMVREFADAALEFGAMADSVTAFAEAAEGVIGLVEEGLAAAVMLSEIDFGAVVQGWHLAGQIETFRNIIRTLIREFSEAATEFGSMAESVEDFADAADAVLGLVIEGIEAIQALSETDFGALVQGWHLAEQIEIFRNIIRTLIREFSEAATEFGSMAESVEAFADAAGAVVDLVEPAIEAIGLLANYSADTAGLSAALNSFIADLVALTVALAAGFQQIAAQIGESIQDAADFADNAGALIDVVAPGIEALAAIAQYETVAGIRVAAAAFAQQLVAVVIELANAFNSAATTAGSAMAQAADFAENAEAILDVVEPGVEALAAVATYFPIAGIRVAAAAFGQQLVAVLVELANAFNSAAANAGAAVAQAAAFAESAADILDVVEPGIEALAALAGYVAATGIQAAVQVFAADLVTLVQTMAGALAAAAGQIGAATDQAAVFAEQAEAIVDVVEPGIEALGALAEYVSTSGVREQTQAFAADLVTLITALAQGLAASGLAANQAVTEAAALSDSLTEILDVVEPGVEALQALATYVSTAGLAGAVQTFAADLVTVIVTLVEALQQAGLLANQAVLEAGEMSGALEDIVGVIEPAVEAVVALVGYTTVGGLKTNVQQFAADLVIVVQTLVDGLAQAGLLANQAVAEAGEMAGHIEDILSVVEPALHPDKGALSLIAKYVSDGGLIQKTQQFTTDLITVTQILVDGLTTSALAAGVALTKAGEMAKSLKDLFDAIGNSIAAIDKITAYAGAANLAQKTQQFTDDLVTVATILVTGLTAAADQLGAEAVSAAHAFAQTVGLLVSRIQAVVSSLSTMGEIDTPNISPILTYIVTSAEQIAAAAQQSGVVAQAVAQMAVFRDNVRQLVDEVIGALAELARLVAANAPGSVQAVLTAMLSAFQNQAGAFVGAGATIANNFITGWQSAGWIGSGQFAVTQIAAGVSSSAPMLINAVSSLIQAILNQAQAFVSNFAEVGRQLIESAAAGMAAAAQSVTNAALDAVADAVGAAMNAASAADAVGNQFIDSVVAAINGGRGEVISAVNDLVDAAIDAGVGAAHSADAVGDEIVDAINGAINGGASSVKAAVEHLVSEAIDAGRNAAKAATAIGQELVNAANTAMAQGRSTLDAAGTSAGNALIDGLTRSINQGRSQVVQAIINTVQAAINAAQNALGISSPSRVFGQIAAQTIEGFVRVFRASDDIAGSVGRAMDAAVQAATDRLAGAKLSVAVQPSTASRATIASGVLPRPATAGPSYQTAGRAGAINIYGNIVLPNVSNPISFLEELDALRGGG